MSIAAPIAVPPEPDTYRTSALTSAKHRTRYLRAERRRIVKYQAWLAVASAIAGVMLEKVWDSPTFGGPHVTVFVISCGFAYFMWTRITGIERHLEFTNLIDPADAYLQIQTWKQTARARQRDRRGHLARATLLKLVNQLIARYVYTIGKHMDEAADEADAPENLDIAEQINEHFFECLNLIVESIEKSRRDLFGYSEAETYFIDIFEIRNDGRLHLIARRKSNDAVHHGRSWEVGQGHIGDCVAKGQALRRMYADHDAPEFSEQLQPTDKYYFKSRISAPIIASDLREYNSCGAICFTSSEISRFDIIHVDFSATVAALLAPLFHVRQIALATLLPEEEWNAMHWREIDWEAFPNLPIGVQDFEDLPPIDAEDC